MLSRIKKNGSNNINRYNYHYSISSINMQIGHNNVNLYKKWQTYNSSLTTLLASHFSLWPFMQSSSLFSLRTILNKLLWVCQLWGPWVLTAETQSPISCETLSPCCRWGTARTKDLRVTKGFTYPQALGITGSTIPQAQRLHPSRWEPHQMQGLSVPAACGPPWLGAQSAKRAPSYGCLLLADAGEAKIGLPLHW